MPWQQSAAAHRHPRIGRPDKVDSIAESMRSDGYRPEKPMLVRPLNGGYQIVGGHSRHLAARESGLAQVFCAVEPMDDDEAVLRLGSDNINDPLPWYSICLYICRNATKDSKQGLSRTQLIKAATGKNGNAAEMEARRRGDAGEVLEHLLEQSVINDGLLNPETNRTLHLAEIHAAPKWLWSALGGNDGRAGEAQIQTALMSHLRNFVTLDLSANYLILWWAVLDSNQ